MKLEYDPAKSERNARERQLPFDRVAEMDWDTAIVKPSPRHQEPRYVAAGYLEDRLHIVCYLYTQLGARIISFRKAKQKEATKYGLQLRRVPEQPDGR